MEEGTVLLAPGERSAEMNNGGNKQFEFEKVEAEMSTPGLQFEKHFLHIHLYL